MSRYAGVVFNLAVDQVFQYEIPEKLRLQVARGVRVRVPFRRSVKTGFVVDLQETSDLPYIKPVFSVIDDKPLVPIALIELARWISDTYLAPQGKAINLMLPPGIRQKAARRLPVYVQVPAGQSYDNELLVSLSSPARRILEFLTASKGRSSLKEILLKTQVSRSTVEGLSEKGLLLMKRERQAPDSFQDTMPYLPPKDLRLTEDQQKAIQIINETIQSGKSQVVLIHGVTGSGKTEVYIRAIQSAITSGKRAIVLVPEIALTPQTFSRFQAYFPKIALLHSYMTSASRADEWERARNGEVDVVIGTRSAIFAPLSNLGIIVIDEEHETSYKEHQDPKYHARDVAIKRAGLEGAVVVLGSATPSLESWHNAINGRYKLVTLPKRVQEIRMPSVEIVDMRSERGMSKRYAILSNLLRSSVEEVLSKNEQVILFLNRRGFTTYITCTKCKLVLTCTKCDVVLSFHKASGRCLCHYCLEERENPEKCPRCFSEMRQFGTGTEKVEEELSLLFPDKRIGRMDSDSMRTRSDYRETLTSLVSGKTDILVGTQMIAKGLDVPSVTLVGVISADTAFSVPDFRSAERTFQLVTQVAGRAGRGPKGGRVIVQTNNPTHYSIICAATYNYDGFAQKELKMREGLHYPPFGLLIRIVITSKDEKMLRDKSASFVTTIKSYLEENEAVILGPAVCPIYRMKGMYRMHILIKAISPSTVLRKLKFMLEEYKPGSVKLSVDVDPVDVL